MPLSPCTWAFAVVAAATTAVNTTEPIHNHVTWTSPVMSHASAPHALSNPVGAPVRRALADGADGNARLIVDPNAVPAGLRTLQQLQTVTSRYGQVVELRGDVDCLELPLRDSPQFARHATGRSRVSFAKQVQRRVIAKRLNRRGLRGTRILCNRSTILSLPMVSRSRLRNPPVTREHAPGAPRCTAMVWALQPT